MLSTSFKALQKRSGKGEIHAHDLQAKAACAADDRAAHRLPKKISLHEVLDALLLPPPLGTRKGGIEAEEEHQRGEHDAFLAAKMRRFTSVHAFRQPSEPRKTL